MAESSKPTYTVLKINWKFYFIPYLLSVLAIPLFGIGLLALFWIYKKQHSIKYHVSDHQISSVDSKYTRNIDLANIENIRLQQGWIHKKLGVGTLILETSASSLKLKGMEGPKQLRQILEQAIANEKKRLQTKKEQTSQPQDTNPGGMENMNYLTGLWQQGLISEEDFEQERKKFE